MGSFHGRTVGAVSLTWTKKYREPFGPLLPGVDHVPYNNLARLDKAVDDTTAAVFLEPVQGRDGGSTCPSPFRWGAQALCRERGALLVMDEIQTGFGRTGRWFRRAHFNVSRT